MQPMREQDVWRYLTAYEQEDVEDLELRLYELLDQTARLMELRLLHYRRGQMRRRRETRA